MRYKGIHHGDNVLYIDYIVNPSFGINSRNEYAFANNQHLDFLVRISYLFEIDKCFSVSYGKKRNSLRNNLSAKDNNQFNIIKNHEKDSYGLRSFRRRSFCVCIPTVQ